MKAAMALILLATAILVSSCAPSGTAGTAGPVELRWWHINSDLPAHQAIESIARRFETLNPGVSVKVTMLDNMEYRSKLQLEFAAGDPPDLFHSWGGGGMADQASKGFLRDIGQWVRSESWKSRINESALELYSVGSSVYGFPQDLGAVGFWYNEDLLARAGWTAFPDTWSQFLDLCRDLKNAGIVPVSLGFSDRWPAMYWWAYLGLRIGGPDLFEDILAGRRSFADPALIEAGRLLQELNALDVFPPTALGDDFSAQSRHMGDGKAAMQLMGQWALAVMAHSSEQKDTLVPVMKFAPFPAVAGGKGTRSDAMGGANGFVIGRNAPDKAIELLEFFARAENLQLYFDAFPAIPTVQAVTVNSKGLTMVKDYLASMTSFCLYPDQMFREKVNAAINEVSARILGGELNPAEGCALLDDLYRKGE